jgi:hypothetical protein
MKKNLIFFVLFTCLLSIYFIIYPSIYFPVLLSLLGLYFFYYSLSFKTIFHYSLFLINLFNFLFLLLLYAVYFFDYFPIMMTDNRFYYFKDLSILKSLFSISIYFLGFTLYSYSVKYFIKSEISNFFLTRKYIYLFVILSIVSSFFINSGGSVLDGGYGGDNYKSNYWGGLSLVFAISISFLFAHNYRFSNFLMTLFLFFILIFWLFSGNRSEVLFFSFFLIFPFFKTIKINAVNLVFIGLLLFSLFIFFDFIGTARVIGLNNAFSSYSLGFTTDSDKINISTVGSSMWTLISLFSISHNQKFLLGSSYLDYFINSIPSFIPTTWEKVSDISYLTREADTLGGLFILGEPYLNFGFFGIIFFTVSFILLLNQAIRSSAKSFLAFVFFVNLIFYYQRYYYYGFLYLFKLLLFWFFIYVFYSFLNKKA